MYTTDNLIRQVRDSLLNHENRFKHWQLEYEQENCRVGLISNQNLHPELLERLEPYHSPKQRCLRNVDFPKLVILDQNTLNDLNLPSLPKTLKPITLHSRESGLISQGWINESFPKYVKNLVKDFQFIIWDKDLIIAIGNLAEKPFRREIIKLIRALFDIETLKQGWLKVQFGVVTNNGDGIAFTGPKDSGKTTFITRYLNNQDKEFNYGSNDKSYIKFQENEFRGLGTPQLIGVRPGTLSTYKNFKDYADHNFKEKQYFTPQKFVEYFKTNIQTSWVIKQVIVPALDLEATKIERLPIDNDEVLEIIESSLFVFSDESIPNWLINELLPEFDEMKSQLREDLLEPLMSLPWSRLRGLPFSHKMTGTEVIQ